MVGTMLAWPTPALLTWLLAWGVFLTLQSAGCTPAVAFVLAQGAATAGAWRGSTPWRQGFMAGGFPLSLLALGHAQLPAWLWLLPLAGLLLIYPRRSWRDAPLFPTPTRALQGLAGCVPLPPGARVLDAGCGLGAGLMALHAEYPAAQLMGQEWSWPLALACQARCRFARVRRADIWAQSWAGLDLVYLFQRPESMARAGAKARQEMASGRWLVSLEFAVPGWTPTHQLETVAGKPVWVYRLP